MKKFALLLFSWFLLFGLSTKALAAQLLSGTLLTIGPASFFSMTLSTAGPTITSMTSISPNSTDGGILLNTMQPMNPTGNHPGLPNYSTDFGPIDKPWEFLGQTGHHFQDLAAGGISADPTFGFAYMYGWRVAFAGLPAANLGTGPLATFTMVGTSYTLDYTTCIPAGDPSGLGGVCIEQNLKLSSALPLSPFETAQPSSDYTLHLEGNIIYAVPEPASLALLGTGLACLIGIKRKRNK